MEKRGDRIELIYTSAEHTRARPGDRGTIVYVERTRITVEWDRHIGLSLIPGADRWKIIREE